MKNYILTLIILICSQISLSQNFEVISTTILIDSTLNDQLIDMDNSPSVDYLYFTETDTAVLARVFLNIDSLLITLPLQNLNSLNFILEDMDNDNRLDIVTSISQGNQDVLSIFYQMDSLKFSEPEVVDTLIYTLLGVQDIDRNGDRDIIVTTSDSLYVYQNSMDNGWELFNELAIPNITQFHFYDGDNKDFNELLITNVSNDSLQSVLYNLEVDEWTLDDSAKLPAGDVLFNHADHNLDGIYDLYALKSGLAGATISIIVNDSLKNVISTADDIHHWFVADFNSDGLVDILTAGESISQEKFLRLYINAGNDDFLSNEIFVQHAIENLTVFDHDYDGDIDVILRTRNNGVQVVTVYDNITSEVNIGPTIVPEHVAFVKFDGVVLAWAATEDDFTVSQSINHDVFIGRTFSDSELVSPDFDLGNIRRMRARKGNSGIRGEYDLNKKLASDIYSYGIQSIDNGLHYLVADGSGSGGGNGSPLLAYGQFIVCDELAKEVILLCSGDTFNYQFDPPAYVYSENDGYLGRIEGVLIGSNASDTLYIATPNSLNCEDYRAIIIQTVIINDILPSDSLIACFNSTIELNIDTPIDSLSWQTSSGFASDSSSLIYSPIEDDSVFVEVFVNGCSFKDSLSVIVPPPYDLDRIEYTINLGESVRIETGLMGISAISWAPVNGLSDISLSPLASPQETTLYNLQALDSIGCDLELEVLVHVESLGFIPNLFTPNSDGQNDRLTVYGLGNIQSLNLRIFNRSGSLVYESNNPLEVRSNGWDGTWQGKEQPNGPYYWKVSGRYNDGEIVLLNGKGEGVVHLMR